MPIRRLASTALAAALIATLGATASAQFGNILKKAKPSVPGAKAAADPPPQSFSCEQLDESLIDKAVKAHQNSIYDSEVAKANAKRAQADAKKAQADALRTKSAQSTVGAMMQNADCKDAKKEKDPRMKEARRLEDLLAAANDRGDEAKAAEISRKLDPLNEAIEIDADRACGGKGSAALHDCMEKKKAELSKQGLAGPMLQIQAQGACMSDPSTSGVVGMTGPSDEEKKLDAEYDALMKEYQDLMSNAKEKADKAQQDAMGLGDREYGVFLECVIGVLRKDPEMTSRTTPQVREAIRKYADVLEKAVH
jgi:hypothetical protein